ncbi:RxLR effector protein [Phytophthora megakarya]|uniref:RxLR effector protein n=1 Tax=Phytophthora megakarya TaxID=4795 RepID=A0A225VWR7_9STRA|nr:RxLR effector protein [Phytophthora megakarya]
MRSHKSVLVVVVLYLLGLTVNLTVAKAHSSVVEQSRLLAKRILRVHNNPNENDEERVIGAAVSSVASHLTTGALKVADFVKLRTWLYHQKSVDDMLDTLLLTGKMDDIIQNPNLKLLDNYVDMFNNKYPEQKISLVKTLAARHGDIDLAIKLSRAKEYSNTKDIATKLQTQQLEGWFNSKKTVEDVFSLLKIKEEGTRFVFSRKLETMDSYIRMFDVRNPQQKTDKYKVLCDGFGGEDKFAIVISQAMKRPLTALEAVKYHYVMFNRWFAKDYDPMTVLIKVFKYSEDDVAKALPEEKLVKDTYKLLYNREMGIFDHAVVTGHRR